MSEREKSHSVIALLTSPRMPSMTLTEMTPVLRVSGGRETDAERMRATTLRSTSRLLVDEQRRRRERSTL